MLLSLTTAMTEPATPSSLYIVLSHLPELRQQQLRKIIHLMHQSPLRIYYLILFGSYARGNWVAVPENLYFSDYDLMAVTPHGHFLAVRWALVYHYGLGKFVRHIQQPVGQSFANLIELGALS